MDVSIIDIFWMAIALIKAVVLIAGIYTSSSDVSSGTAANDTFNPTDFDITKPTR